MGRLDRRWKITLAAPLLGLLLLEGALRLTGAEPVRNPRARGAVVRSSSIPGLRFQPAPGGVLVLDFGEDRPRGPREVEHRVNAQGLRGPELPLPREAGAGPRIVCVGDSHTFGTGVAAQQAWPARLQTILRASGLARADVGNAGVPGYDTSQEALWLEATVLPLRPDLVLVQYFVNDTAMRGLDRPGEAEPGWLTQLAHPRRGGWVGALRDHWRTADLMLDALYRGHGLADHIDQLDRWHSPGDPGWEQAAASLVRMRDLVQSFDAAFGVVLFPMLLEGDDGYASHDALARVAAFCREQGMAVFDGEPTLLASGLTGDALRVAPGDMHASAEAHAAFADGVARWLRTPESRTALIPSLGRR
jgi:hypothetical protein